MEPLKKISVIGLGAMGAPMASSLLKGGYEVRGFDVDRERMSELVPLGLKPAGSPMDAAKGVDLVMLSLPGWNVVKEVIEGKRGVLEGAQRGLVIIDCSTVPPRETKAMASRLAPKGIHWMDVPVSGASNQAREGNLVFMAGGKKSIFKQVKPVLDRIGKKTVYAGKNGDASMLKAVVNQVLFLTQAAAVEGLTLGLKAGLDPELLYDALVSGAASSNLIETRGKDMIAGRFDPKGALWIAAKDLQIALDSAAELGAAVPMASLYRQFLLSAQNRGWGKEDATVVMRIYGELSGGGSNP